MTLYDAAKPQFERLKGDQVPRSHVTMPPYILDSGVAIRALRCQISSLLMLMLSSFFPLLF